MVPAGKELALDLNGNTLKAANTDTGNIQVYGTLTIRDSTDAKANGGGSGKIYTETEYTGGATGYALVNAANGGAVIMQSGLIDSSSFTDDNTNKGQFAIGVDNVTSDASFTMNGGKITSGWYAVCGNGQLQSHNGNITVNGGILESVADYAIYCPQMGTVEINGGVVYGAAGGVHMNSGRLLVSGGTITSKGVGDTGDWGDGTGGSNCAAINVKALYGDVNAKITGGTITAEGDALVLSSGQQHDAKILVSGGVFNKAVPESFCAPGFKPVENSDGTFGVQVPEADRAAEVNGVYYPSLVDAIEAAPKGGIVKLLKSQAIDKTLAVDSDVTIDFGGNNVTANNVRAIHVKSGKLTLTGEGIVTSVKSEGGALVSTNQVIRVGDNDGEDGRKAELLIDANVVIDAPSTYGVGAFGTKTEESIEVRGTIKSVVEPALAGLGTVSYGPTNYVLTETAKLTTEGQYVIYHPQAGSLKINGATIEGKGGIEAKGGTIDITGDATITATATETSHNKYSNGVSTSGYAIAAVDNEDYAGAVRVNIDGAVVTGLVDVAVDDEVADDKKASISITGGSFSSDPSKFVPEAGYVVNKAGERWAVSKYVPPVTPPTPSDKTEVEHNQDGSTTTTVTKPDGSQTITHETATGTESVVKKDKDGNVTSTEVTVSKQDAASGKVELPIEGAEPAADASKAPEVEVKVPASVSDKAPVQVTVPVAKAEGDEPNYGIVVFAVDEDGNETVIPKCSVDKDGNAVFEATGNVTIKVVDNAKDMPDVKDSDWFAGDVVDFATARGIVNGVNMPDGSRVFDGYGKTTRGMFVAMLHNLELNPEAAGEDSLADVPSDAFYADAAAWALEEGILSGVDMPDGSKRFQGDAPVTREQVAVFLMRYAEHLGMDVSKRAEIDFPDASEVSGFARDAMSWAVAEDLFKGDDATGELNPTDGAARAEVAAVLMRFISLMYA